MTFLDQVRARRQKLADVMSDEDYSGIREIVEELYPDQAHFLYELLQNAEDAGAHVARFELHNDKLVFTHDGQPFSENDVLGITNIGKGTKKEADDKIGRFGVGFKAVFGYSETPHIYSPTFSFKITDLVLPHELPSLPGIGDETRFVFPFNNPKKPVGTAFSEIASGLNELAETTLLFLTNIECVMWSIAGGTKGEVLRAQHSAHHYEILKQVGASVASSSHFMKFEQPVEGLEQQYVAVAFELDFLFNVQSFNAEEPLHRQMRIAAAKPGRVAVFFPAEKEASGLHFHLHAPFVPELSRASIKESPANAPLFQQLATLTAGSLHQIRDLKLLNVDFLAVLPNPQDDLPRRYECVRQAIVDSMNTQPLTPTNKGSHAPAESLLQAKAVLKDLLSRSDLTLFHSDDERSLQWAVSATQRNSDVDRFLSSLDIAEWDIAQFSEALTVKLGESWKYWLRPDPRVAEWLSEKSVEWHQRLYATLYAELQPVDRKSLKKVKLIRLRDGNYSLGSECFFLDGSEETDDILRPVDEAIYNSGRSKAQHENARKFLVEMGVREVGEVERVEAILKRRYVNEAEIPHEKIHYRDLKRFMALVKKDSGTVGMFVDYYIFQGEDGSLHKPNSIYLDVPYKATGLSRYYHALGDAAWCVGLSKRYLSCGSDKQSVATFVEAVGAETHLVIELTSCFGNPAYHQLVSDADGNWSDSYGVNQDYTIEYLDTLVVEPDVPLARLVWATISSETDIPWHVARYRNNSKYPVNEKPSQLACVLRDARWLPQTDGRFVRPAEATQELLPPGFSFDAGWPWLKALDFGLEATKRSEEYRRKQAVAKDLGFADTQTLERAQRFSLLPPDYQAQMLAEYERKSAELPYREPSNPGRRAERIGEEAANAPERHTEERTRSVSTNRGAVKGDADMYLRSQYTNSDGDVICQVCKAPLPFKRDDGTEYFERVEFLSSLVRHYFQNYLCLCPNHAAMFKHANGSADLLTDMFAEMSGNELEIVLAQQDMTLYFTKTHVADLRAVAATDAKSAPEASPKADVDTVKETVGRGER